MYQQIDFICWRQGMGFGETIVSSVLVWKVSCDIYFSSLRNMLSLHLTYYHKKIVANVSNYAFLGEYNKGKTLKSLETSRKFPLLLSVCRWEAQNPTTGISDRVAMMMTVPLTHLGTKACTHGLAHSYKQVFVLCVCECVDDHPRRTSVVSFAADRNLSRSFGGRGGLLLASVSSGSRRPLVRHDLHHSPWELSSCSHGNNCWLQHVILHTHTYTLSRSPPSSQLWSGGACEPLNPRLSFLGRRDFHTG